MSLTLITAPTTEPLTIAEAKRQARLGDTAGEPAPTAITAALASPAVAGNVDNGAHRYRATFVTADGETEGGVISAAVTIADKTVNGKVALSAIPLGGSAVTSRKLYRTEAGGTSYKLLTTLSNNTATTYTDNTADSSLGAEAPTTNTTEDPELTNLIKAVRERCEIATNRALITQTWDLVLDGFPPFFGVGTSASYGSTSSSVYRAGVGGGFFYGLNHLELPKPPLQSVTSVTYADTAGTTQTWAASKYVVQTPDGPRAKRGRLALAYGQAWPSTYGQMGDVTIRFVCGYGAAADVPYLLKAGMLLDLATLYAHRENVIAGGDTLPGGVRDIYWAYRSASQQRGVAA